MPYVSSRIRSLSQRSCIFYALNSVIRMTNAVNFRRLEEPVIYLKHDSSVHLMQRRCKNSQLLFYKCVRAKRLRNLKYLCFRSCWAAHRLDQEDLSQSRFSFPFSVAIFFFPTQPNTIPSTPPACRFSPTANRGGKKKWNKKVGLKNSSCSCECSEPEFNMCVYVKLIIQLTSAKTQSSLYYGNTMERGAMFTKLLMWKKMQMAGNECRLMCACKHMAQSSKPSSSSPSFYRHTSDRVLPFSTLVAMPTHWPPSPPGWPRIPRVSSYWWEWWKPPWSRLCEVNNSGQLCGCRMMEDDGGMVTVIRFD